MGAKSELNSSGRRIESTFFRSAHGQPSKSERPGCFEINTTVGVPGLFDPADKWFGLKAHPNDFGLTIRYCDLPTGSVRDAAVLRPSTISDIVGLVADVAMILSAASSRGMS